MKKISLHAFLLCITFKAKGNKDKNTTSKHKTKVVEEPPFSSEIFKDTDNKNDTADFEKMTLTLVTTLNSMV